ncbi:MAG: hypothetical protein ACLFQV_11130 [Vulcanimicrobiota bacterium]
MAPDMAKDEFYEHYSQKFQQLVTKYGKFLQYDNNKVAVDVGTSLKKQKHESFDTGKGSKVWFQLYGIQQEKFPVKQYQNQSSVKLELHLEELKCWYASPETIYLVVYVESADLFLAQEIKSIVNRYWGDNIFKTQSLQADNKKIEIEIENNRPLNDIFLKRVFSHHKMKINGPAYRGRILGHHLDPLGCIPKQIEPLVFEAMVKDILNAHHYKLINNVNLNEIFEDNPFNKDIIDFSYGIVYHSYEWIFPLFKKPGQENRAILERDINHVQGPCGIIIASKINNTPDFKSLKKIAEYLLFTKGIKRLMVFINDYSDSDFVKSFARISGETGLVCYPHHLEAITFNLLIATSIYLAYRDKINWKTIKYLD